LPQEIGETAAFLVPDGAAYITGRHTTVADGCGPAC
jgi:NAD(P)-dependent dehydrogenase (short-subunit alcohol dehydrogenase family)